MAASATAPTVVSMLAPGEVCFFYSSVLHKQPAPPESSLRRTFFFSWTSVHGGVGGRPLFSFDPATWGCE
jgi:hypothetical protein